MVLASLDPGTGLPLIMVLCVLAGIGVSAMHVMPWAIIPGRHRVRRMENGERNEGMFYSLITLAQKVASSWPSRCAARASGQRLCPHQRRPARQRHLRDSHGGGADPGLDVGAGNRVHLAVSAQPRQLPRDQSPAGRAPPGSPSGRRGSGVIEIRPVRSPATSMPF